MPPAAEATQLLMRQFLTVPAEYENAVEVLEGAGHHDLVVAVHGLDREPAGHATGSRPRISRGSANEAPIVGGSLV